MGSSLNVRQAVKSGRIKPVKSLGQNFLVDEGVAERIVGAADISPSDTVIEIGPGLAALTETLCRRAGYVIAVEIDRHIIPALEEKMSGYENFKLIHADILKLDLREIAEDAGFEQTSETPDVSRRLKVVSNLPYYITTPVIMKFLEGDIRPAKMVFMMQKEVADRITARPSTKAYGALTVSANYYMKPCKAFNVSPHCFVPQPDVESSVLVFEPHDKQPVELLDRQLFFKVVRAAFAHRRKQLMNCLIHAGLLPNDRELAGRVFGASGLLLTARGEELDITHFARLCNEISQLKEKYYDVEC
jgi:16S rRNA (adenine1518-N6/adenine1519-N6)-dimethyltransferase